MALPAYSLGQTLTIADFNNYLVTPTAWKASDTPRTNTTTQTADPDLSVPLNAPNGIYQVKAIIFYQGAVGNNFANSWLIPSGATFTHSIWHYFNSVPNVLPAWWPAGSVANGYCDGSSGRMYASYRGVCVMGGTAGSITLLWAQGTSSGTATVVAAYSHLMVRQVG